MVWVLALRHLLVRPGRAVLLLGGYALGVAVMIVLLSIGDAMLDQSRDVALIGGGELTALPHGIDVEAMRTGGLAGMFLGIDGARFVSRELLGGARQSGIVAAVSPIVEQKLVTLRTPDTAIAVRAGGEIPSRAAAAGAALDLVAGTWRDTPADRQWIAPSATQAYDEIDRFHTPPVDASTWAEWDYVNVVTGPDEWWYITLLVAGDVRRGAGQGEVLVTHRRPGGGYQRFASAVPAPQVSFDTMRAELTVGGSELTQRDGIYHLRGGARGATFDLTISPTPREYFPAIELGDGGTRSGYAVPVLAGVATGRLCAGARCTDVRAAPAYHDHNWGSWRAVTWEWGTGRSATRALLYGGVIPGNRAPAQVPYFLALEDSLGIAQVYRFDQVRSLGARDVPGAAGIVAPDSLAITATHGEDTLRLAIRVVDVAASTSAAAGPDRVFLQLRGRWSLGGTAGGAVVSDSGTGFFETWVGRGSRPANH